jgi:L-glutamine---4-(methylsulfanyl)-2-oxobutanoate aminotransferase
VAVLFGGKTGLVELAQVYLNAGDVALVPDPGYPDYWSGVALAGGRMVTMPLLQENRFLPDFERLTEEELASAKMMFLNYPNNPTGAIADEDFYASVVRVCESNQILCIHDFAYGAIGFDGNKPRSFLQTAGAKEVGIEIYTMSKTFNMAGWRIAFAVGNQQVIEQINLIQDHYYVSLFGAIQKAGVAALTGPADCIHALVGTYESRRNALMDQLEASGLVYARSGGSFFCWLPVPTGLTSVQYADQLLYQADVAVAPGVGFGRYGEGFVRLGLLAPIPRLREAAQRIAGVTVTV